MRIFLRDSLVLFAVQRSFHFLEPGRPFLLAILLSTLAAGPLSARTRGHLVETADAGRFAMTRRWRRASRFRPACLRRTVSGSNRSNECAGSAPDPSSAVRTDTRTSPPDSTKRTCVEPPLLSGTRTRISWDDVGGAAGGSMIGLRAGRGRGLLRRLRIRSWEPVRSTVSNRGSTISVLASGRANLSIEGPASFLGPSCSVPSLVPRAAL